MKLFKFISPMVKTFKYMFGFGLELRVKTEQYPDKVSGKVPVELPQKSRGLLVNDLKICTGCGDCIPVCESSCISIDYEKFAKEEKHVQAFRIDLARCFFCGLCVDVCEVNSIKFSREFELAGFQRNDLLIEFTPEQSRMGDFEKEQKLKKMRIYEVVK